MDHMISDDEDRLDETVSDNFKMSIAGFKENL